ncbi:response regulator [Ramlibacter sp. PS4R-6]|uniref:response regulator n=1 Tax=Ramlibacter sp. PS4R-6 TaxID=3133438 RepID=UPI00309A04E5
MSTPILVVEDTPANMKFVTMLLRSAGHQVLQARTGEEGIALAREHGPQLVLMDMNLPGMDGLQATRILKADVRTRGIPVVAVTALAMAGDRERILAAGCDGYVAKPIRYKDFLQEVERFAPAPLRAAE